MDRAGLTGSPHPLGHRVDLAWTAPAGPGAVRLVRRTRTHPVDPADGVAVAAGAGLAAAADAPLPGEVPQYYTLFTADGTVLDRTCATPTARYGFAELLHDLLPAAYRRFDAERGALRRFLELPGSQLDQLYSLAASTRSVLDLDRVDGRLLPLLAGWIGWSTDHRAPVRRQRAEVRAASRVYGSAGALPAALATVTRVTGGSARIQEYLHNVATTNRPPRLNLWAVTRGAAGAWGAPELLSVNAAPGGRATHLRDPDGAEVVLYHTTRRHGPDVWAKRRSGGGWEPSGPVVDRPGADLYPSAAAVGTRQWLFWEAPGAPVAAGERPRLLWSATRDAGGAWSAPAPFGPPGGPSRRNPAAVAAAGSLWLFWRERTVVAGVPAWTVRWDVHDGTAWRFSGTAAGSGALPDGGAVEDDLVAMADAGRLWLFWARQDALPDGRHRWEIALRVKQGLDPAAADWSAVTVVPKADPGDHDREPAPLTAPGGVELFRATTAFGGWSVVGSTFAAATGTWGPVTRIGDGPASERAPLALTGSATETLLLYRSDASLMHVPRLLDARYAGATTLRSGDPAARALRGRFGDPGTCTPRPGAWPAPDGLGVYLDAAPEPGGDARLAAVLGDFLPVSVRVGVLAPGDP